MTHIDNKVAMMKLIAIIGVSIMVLLCMVIWPVYCHTPGYILEVACGYLLVWKGFVIPKEKEMRDAYEEGEI